MRIDQTTYGLASFQNESVTSSPELFAGDTPQVVTVGSKPSSAILTAGLPRWTPVVVNHDGGEMTLPDVAGGTPANAITLAAIPAGSPEGFQMPVYKAGCFSIEALNWGDLTDDADKFALVAGSDNIVVKYRGEGA